MNTATILKAPDRNRTLPRCGGPGGDHRHGSPADIGLWVFIAVATSLFSLFIAAYIMRMENNDWTPAALPWQLWLSTALLFAGSASMEAATRSIVRMRSLVLAGGICAFAFIGVQLWGWQTLLDMRVLPAGNPAASFFYLLTTMHGLHVLGGIAVWSWTVRRMNRGNPADNAWRIKLCARYWHFLLVAWVALYATFTGLTPGIVAYICGR